MLPSTPSPFGQALLFVVASCFHEQLLINLNEAEERCYDGAEGSRKKERGILYPAEGWKKRNSPCWAFALRRENSCYPKPQFIPLPHNPQIPSSRPFSPPSLALKGLPANPLTLLFTTDQQAMRMPCHSSAERRTLACTHRNCRWNSRNATWQLKRGRLASFWSNGAGCYASWSGLWRWWPVSCPYNQDAFQCTPPKRAVAERPCYGFSFKPSFPSQRWRGLSRS